MEHRRTFSPSQVAHTRSSEQQCCGVGYKSQRGGPRLDSRNRTQSNAVSRDQGETDAAGTSNRRDTLSSLCLAVRPVPTREAVDSTTHVSPHSVETKANSAACNPLHTRYSDVPSLCHGPLAVPAAATASSSKDVCARLVGAGLDLHKIRGCRRSLSDFRVSGTLQRRATADRQRKPLRETHAARGPCDLASGVKVCRPPAEDVSVPVDEKRQPSDLVSALPEDARPPCNAAGNAGEGPDQRPFDSSSERGVTVPFISRAADEDGSTIAARAECGSVRHARRQASETHDCPQTRFSRMSGMSSGKRQRPECTGFVKLTPGSTLPPRPPPAPSWEVGAAKRSWRTTGGGVRSGLRSPCSFSSNQHETAASADEWGSSAGTSLSAGLEKHQETPRLPEHEHIVVAATDSAEFFDSAYTLDPIKASEDHELQNAVQVDPQELPVPSDKIDQMISSRLPPSERLKREGTGLRSRQHEEWRLHRHEQRALPFRARSEAGPLCKACRRGGMPSSVIRPSRGRGPPAVNRHASYHKGRASVLSHSSSRPSTESCEGQSVPSDWNRSTEPARPQACSGPSESSNHGQRQTRDFILRSVLRRARASNPKATHLKVFLVNCGATTTVPRSQLGLDKRWPGQSCKTPQAANGASAPRGPRTDLANHGSAADGATEGLWKSEMSVSSPCGKLSRLKEQQSQGTSKDWENVQQLVSDGDGDPRATNSSTVSSNMPDQTSPLWVDSEGNTLKSETWADHARVEHISTGSSAGCPASIQEDLVEVLSSEGQKQAIAAAKLLRPMRFAMIYCSDDIPCQEMKNVILTVNRESPYVDDRRLHSRKKGELANVSNAEFVRRATKAGFTKETFRPPGGESLEDVRERMVVFFLEALVGEFLLTLDLKDFIAKAAMDQQRAIARGSLCAVQNLEAHASLRLPIPQSSVPWLVNATEKSISAVCSPGSTPLSPAAPSQANAVLMADAADESEKRELVVSTGRAVMTSSMLLERMATDWGRQLGPASLMMEPCFSDDARSASGDRVGTLAMEGREASTGHLLACTNGYDTSLDQPPAPSLSFLPPRMAAAVANTVFKPQGDSCSAFDFKALLPAHHDSPLGLSSVADSLHWERMVNPCISVLQLSVDHSVVNYNSERGMVLSSQGTPATLPSVPGSLMTRPSCGNGIRMNPTLPICCTGSADSGSMREDALEVHRCGVFYRKWRESLPSVLASPQSRRSSPSIPCEEGGSPLPVITELLQPCLIGEGSDPPANAAAAMLLADNSGRPSDGLHSAGDAPLLIEGANPNFSVVQVSSSVSSAHYHSGAPGERLGSYLAPASGGQSPELGTQSCLASSAGRRSRRRRRRRKRFGVAGSLDGEADNDHESRSVAGPGRTIEAAEVHNHICDGTDLSCGVRRTAVRATEQILETDLGREAYEEVEFSSVASCASTLYQNALSTDDEEHCSQGECSLVDTQHEEAVLPSVTVGGCRILEKAAKSKKASARCLPSEAVQPISRMSYELRGDESLVNKAWVGGATLARTTSGSKGTSSCSPANTVHQSAVPDAEENSADDPQTTVGSSTGTTARRGQPGKSGLANGVEDADDACMYSAAFKDARCGTYARHRDADDDDTEANSPGASILALQSTNPAAAAPGVTYGQGAPVLSKARADDWFLPLSVSPATDSHNVQPLPPLSEEQKSMFTQFLFFDETAKFASSSRKSGCGIINEGMAANARENQAEMAGAHHVGSSAVTQATAADIKQLDSSMSQGSQRLTRGGSGGRQSAFASTNVLASTQVEGHRQALAGDKQRELARSREDDTTGKAIFFGAGGAGIDVESTFAFSSPQQIEELSDLHERLHLDTEKETSQSRCASREKSGHATDRQTKICPEMAWQQELCGDEDGRRCEAGCGCECQDLQHLKASGRDRDHVGSITWRNKTNARSLTLWPPDFRGDETTAGLLQVTGTASWRSMDISTGVQSVIGGEPDSRAPAVSGTVISSSQGSQGSVDHCTSAASMKTASCGRQLQLEWLMGAPPADKQPLNAQRRRSIHSVAGGPLLAGRTTAFGGHKAKDLVEPQRTANAGDASTPDAFNSQYFRQGCGETRCVRCILSQTPCTGLRAGTIRPRNVHRRWSWPPLPYHGIYANRACKNHLEDVKRRLELGSLSHWRMGKLYRSMSSVMEVLANQEQEQRTPPAELLPIFQDGGGLEKEMNRRGTHQRRLQIAKRGAGSPPTLSPILHRQTPSGASPSARGEIPSSDGRKRRCATRRCRAALITIETRQHFDSLRQRQKSLYKSCLASKEGDSQGCEYGAVESHDGCNLRCAASRFVTELVHSLANGMAECATAGFSVSLSPIGGHEFSSTGSGTSNHDSSSSNDDSDGFSGTGNEGNSGAVACLTGVPVTGSPGSSICSAARQEKGGTDLRNTCGAVQHSCEGEHVENYRSERSSAAKCGRSSTVQEQTARTVALFRGFDWRQWSGNLLVSLLEQIGPYPSHSEVETQSSPEDSKADEAPLDIKSVTNGTPADVTVRRGTTFLASLEEGTRKEAGVAGRLWDNGHARISQGSCKVLLLMKRTVAQCVAASMLSGAWLPPGTSFEAGQPPAWLGGSHLPRSITGLGTERHSSEKLDAERGSERSGSLAVLVITHDCAIRELLQALCGRRFGNTIKAGSITVLDVYTRRTGNAKLQRSLRRRRAEAWMWLTGRGSNGPCVGNDRDHNSDTRSYAVNNFEKPPFEQKTVDGCAEAGFAKVSSDQQPSTALPSLPFAKTIYEEESRPVPQMPGVPDVGVMLCTGDGDGTSDSTMPLQLENVCESVDGYVESPSADGARASSTSGRQESSGESNFQEARDMGLKELQRIGHGGCALHDGSDDCSGQWPPKEDRTTVCIPHRKYDVAEHGRYHHQINFSEETWCRTFQKESIDSFNSGSIIEDSRQGEGSLPEQGKRCPTEDEIDDEEVKIDHSNMSLLAAPYRSKRMFACEQRTEAVDALLSRVQCWVEVFNKKE